MHEREDVIAAIRASWTPESSAAPALWSPENPALGQCEVAAFVAWEYLGGDLVLGRVMLNGEQTEHHYWNRIDGVDLDLTREQFRGDEIIEELSSLDSASIRAQQDSIHVEMANRMAILRSAVAQRLAESSPAP